MRGHSKANLFLSIVFCLCLFLPTAAMLFPGMNIVPEINEKRRLAGKPQLTAQTYKTFPDEYEAYFNDHFGYRNLFLRFTNLLKLNLLNVSGSTKVIAGKDGWLFYTGNSSYENYMGILPPDYNSYFESFLQQLEMKKRLLEEKDVRYLFVVTPSKWNVYPEHLPDGYDSSGRQTNVDRLLDYISSNSDVEIVDLRKDILAAKKNDNRSIFFKHDSHWNNLGAYYGYLGISSALQKHFPSIKTRALSDFKIVETDDGGGRDLVRMLGVQDDLSEVSFNLTPTEPYQYNLKNTAGQFAGSLAHYERGELSLPRGFMFRDSFSTQVIPYLSDDFSSIGYYWRDWDRSISLPAVLSRFDPDIIIEQRAERYLVPAVPMP